MNDRLTNQINIKSFKQARISRDSRFDGIFFVAVKTTGIYCRPICPATTPKEENIEYYDHAYLAAKAGYRPCLRCHPDSAPGSPIWNGTSTTLRRAKRFIDSGILEHSSLTELANRLGITDRYLRQLFDKHLGVSPKSYALFKQCEFAKNLLHQTNFSITDIAYTSGFKSVRRFNDCFKKQLGLSPSQIRKCRKQTDNKLQLRLYYRPPYNWNHIQSFLSHRLIPKLEWCESDSYGRTFTWSSNAYNESTQIKSEECQGYFTAYHNKEKHRFDVEIVIDNLLLLKPVINNIRRILDLDTDTATIEQHLAKNNFTAIEEGLRLPGTWSVFEAGIRAILGQQISVVAAHKLLKTVIDELGEKFDDEKTFFPSANSISTSNFDFLKMPGKRKQSLIDLAKHSLTVDIQSSPEKWIHIKGIGPWTIDYAKMRGLSDPDIYLGGDLGVKKAIEQTGSHIVPDKASPFRSYLTFQLWNLL